MEASCLFLVAPVENTANMTVLFPCLFIREVERPLSRDCAGRVPLTSGHCSHRNSKLMLCFGFWFLMFVWGFGKTSIFTVHVNWPTEKGAQERRPTARCPRWAWLFFGTVRGNWILEAEEEKCLWGQQSLALPRAALPGEATLRLQDPALPPSVQHRGEKPQRKGRKFIYI